MFLTGIALLTPLGLAGAAVYVAGHALVKAALFLCVGHRAAPARLGQRDRAARPRPAAARRPASCSRWPRSAWPTCRRSPPSSARAGSRTAPPASGLTWITVGVRGVLGAGRRGGAAGGRRRVLRPRRPARRRPADGAGVLEETSETDAGKARTPLTMIVPAAVLSRWPRSSLAFLPHLGVGGRVGRGPVRGPARLQRDGAVRRARRPSGRACRGRPGGITLADVLTGAGSAVGGLLLAFVALYWRRLPLLRRGFEPGTGLVRPIQRFQSGVSTTTSPGSSSASPASAARWPSPSAEVCVTATFATQRALARSHRACCQPRLQPGNGGSWSRTRCRIEASK